MTQDIAPQDIITRDNVTVKVNAVTYFRVVDPNRAILEIEDYKFGTNQVAQTTLRSIVGQADLDQLLINRDEINRQLQQIIDSLTDAWGVKVSLVEVKDVELPDSMRRAMARQAEAERERRAKVIHALGEKEAAETLADAARLLEDRPGGDAASHPADHDRGCGGTELDADLPPSHGDPAGARSAADLGRKLRRDRGSVMPDPLDGPILRKCQTRQTPPRA